MNIDKEQLGNLLKLLRKRKCLSQKELADLLYTSAPMVCKWEKGIFAPTSDMMLRIAHFYDIPVSDLYYPERTLEKLNRPSREDNEKAGEVSPDKAQNRPVPNLLPEKAEGSPLDDTVPEQSPPDMLPAEAERTSSVDITPEQPVNSPPEILTAGKRLIKVAHRLRTTAIAVAAVLFIVAAIVQYVPAGTSEPRITYSVEGYAEDSEFGTVFEIDHIITAEPTYEWIQDYIDTELADYVRQKDLDVDVIKLAFYDNKQNLVNGSDALAVTYYFHVY